jgi:hypothetical protein
MLRHKRSAYLVRREHGGDKQNSTSARVVWLRAGIIADSVDNAWEARYGG